MPRYLSLSGTALACLLVAPALAQQEFPAVLAGHAVLPAQSFINAPSGLTVSGKSTTAPSAPPKSLPLQGHSGIKAMPDGTFWIITDNDFSTRTNSADAVLYLVHYRIDWAAGTFNPLQTIFLHDPDKKVPFRIIQEETDKRYLTGADFDVEGFQWIGDTLWVGDEFGPFVIKADKTGRVLGVFETLPEGRPRHSQIRATVASRSAADASANVTLPRAKGFEGFASSRDQKFLYGRLEGPIWDPQTNDVEKIGDKEATRILEFDVTAERFTGRFWYFVFEQNGNAIGDFKMFDAITGVVIERDNGEGTADKACPPAQVSELCFPDVAKFKRVYKIELSDANVGKPVRKIGYVDLMKIADPDNKARKPLNDGVLTFPFFAIENLDSVDDRHIVVGNGNNLPFSSSRDPSKPDDNELVLLEVTELLQAK
jgi:hypothetical protein